ARAAPAVTCAAAMVLIATGLSFGLPLIEMLLDVAPRLAREALVLVNDFRQTVALPGMETDMVMDDLAAADAVPGLGTVLALAPSLITQVFIFVGTVFFFLLTRSRIYSWIARVLDSACLEARLFEVERTVSRYFATITAINLGFGVCVAIALSLWGMPGALLWGVAAALMNFIVYLGPAIIGMCLLLAGVITYEGALVLVPPAIFFALNFVEGNLVTPAALGQSMSLNPLLVFLSLVFWLWLWGAVGGIVAIPILVAILCLAGHGVAQTNASGTKGSEAPNAAAASTS
ncbi:MAG: AI-2E family transporter, partial [Pseudomonadota bacterium]